MLGLDYLSGGTFSERKVATDPWYIFNWPQPVHFGWPPGPATSIARPDDPKPVRKRPIKVAYHYLSMNGIPLGATSECKHRKALLSDTEKGRTERKRLSGVA